MRFTLIKMSSPGWEKSFPTEIDLKIELFKYICKDCREGVEEYYEDELVYQSDPVYEHSTVDEMLSTSCGCEFAVETYE